jgi:hypothetical protein
MNRVVTKVTGDLAPPSVQAALRARIAHDFADDLSVRTVRVLWARAFRWHFLWAKDKAGTGRGHLYVVRDR